MSVEMSSNSRGILTVYGSVKVNNTTRFQILLNRGSNYSVKSAYYYYSL